MVKTAFVLSGGGSLGAVQAGMLSALLDQDLHPDLLVGASAGALNAAFIAGHGFTPDAVAMLIRLWRSLRRQDVFPFAPRRHLLALAGIEASICAPDRLEKLVRHHIPYALLEDATVPVHIVATDVLSGTDAVISSGDSVAAVMASAAIPAIFPSVEVGGRAMFDGGVANKTPISHAAALGAERIVVLPTGYACDLREPPSTAAGNAVHALTLLTEQRLIFDVTRYHAAVELIVIPPLCPLSVSPVDFRHTGELILRARQSTTRWLDEGRQHLPHPERFLSMHGHASEPACERDHHAA